MGWLDSHCHINDEQFKDDLDIVLQNMVSANVTKAMVISSYIKDYEYAKTITHKDIDFKRSLGIYPGDVDSVDDELLQVYYKMYKDEDIKAIGEIGLDYHYRKDNKEKQIKIFIEQLKMAQELDKPIIVHTREAIQDTYDILKKYPCKGVIHCYSDSAMMAKNFVKLGYFISISGTITWHNAREPLEVIRSVPIDRLLIETDCPYLSPVPNRGKRNEPSNVVYTGKKICEELGINEEFFKFIINDNYDRLFGI